MSKLTISPHLQEPAPERECVPVRRRLCSEAASYSPYTGDTCDTELETVCTTILATKYVKVIHTVLLVGSFKGEIPAKI